MADRRRRKRRPLAPARAQRQGALRLGLVLAVLVSVNLYVFLWRDGTSLPKVMDKAAMAGEANPVASAPGASAEPEPWWPPRIDLEVATAAAEAEAMHEGLVPEQAEPENRVVDGAVQRGDSLGRILRREGMTPPEADAVIRALQGHMDFRAIKEGQTYRLEFDDTGQLQAFEFHVSRTTTARVKREPGGELVGDKVEAETTLRVNEVGGRIDSSLYAAIKAQNEDTALVSFFVDVFAYDLNFYTDQHPGDTFRILVEKEYLGDEFLRYKRVIGAEYAGRAGTFRAFQWTVPGQDEPRYFDEKGRSIERSLLKTPLKYTRISSRFNPRRMHPILHKRRGHMGVDYAAPTGTPVWAAANGKIVFRGWGGGAGNMVILKHDNGLQTVYMHLSKFRSGQRTGQYVRGKTVIGYVGSTGMSTGPHLHFGVKENGRYVDPMSLKMSRGPGVPGKHLAQFERETAAVVARLAEITVPDAAPVVATDAVDE